MILTREILQTMLDATWVSYKHDKDKLDEIIKHLRQQFSEEHRTQYALIERLDDAIHYIDIDGDDPLYAYIRAA